MLTAGDILAKTLAKSQKVTFQSQKNSFRCFFFFANCWRCSKGGAVRLSFSVVALATFILVCLWGFWK